MRKIFSYLQIMILSTTLFTQQAFGQCSSDPNIVERRKECDEIPGMTFVCGINRCVYTEESGGYQDQWQDCESKAYDVDNMSNPSADKQAEVKACYDNLARQYSEDQGLDLLNDDEDSKLELVQKGMVVLQVVHIIFNWVAQGANPFSGCTPRKMYAGAGAFAIFNEISNHESIKDAVEDKKKKYDKEQKQSNGFDQQLRSFEYLAEYHDEINRVAGDKSKNYNMLAATYGVVAVMAIIEASKGVDSCIMDVDDVEENPTDVQTPGTETAPAGSGGTTGFLFKNYLNPKLEKSLAEKINYSPTEDKAVANFIDAQKFLRGEKQSLSLDEYSEIKKHKNLLNIGSFELKTFTNLLASAFINEAKAMDPMMLMPLIGLLSGGGDAATPDPAVVAKKEKASGFFSNSVGIATMAGLNATLALILGMHYKKVKKKARDNASEIRNMAQRFASISTKQCGLRDDKSVPECFCYTPSGAVNGERENSTECANYFNSLIGGAPLAVDYDQTTVNDIKACFTKDNEFDRNCDCKKNDTCKKVSSEVNFGGIGTIRGTADIGEMMNLGFEGNLSQAGITDQAAGQSAFNSYKAMKKAQERFNDQRAKDGKKTIPFGTKLESKIIDKIAPQKLLDSQKGNISLGFPGAPQPALKGKNSKTALKLFKKAQNRKRASYKSVGSRKSKSGKSYSSGFKMPSFGKKKNSNGRGKVLSFKSEKKRYKYGKSALHSEDGASLFQIITNRYKRSAKKHLDQ